MKIKNYLLIIILFVFGCTTPTSSLLTSSDAIKLALEYAQGNDIKIDDYTYNLEVSEDGTYWIHFLKRNMSERGYPAHFSISVTSSQDINLFKGR